MTLKDILYTAHVGRGTACACVMSTHTRRLTNTIFIILWWDDDETYITFYYIIIFVIFFFNHRYTYFCSNLLWCQFFFDIIIDQSSVTITIIYVYIFSVIKTRRLQWLSRAARGGKK